MRKIFHQRGGAAGGPGNGSRPALPEPMKSESRPWQAKTFEWHEGEERFELPLGGIYKGNPAPHWPGIDDATLERLARARLARIGGKNTSDIFASVQWGNRICRELWRRRAQGPMARGISHSEAGQQFLLPESRRGKKTVDWESVSNDDLARLAKARLGSLREKTISAIWSSKPWGGAISRELKRRGLCGDVLPAKSVTRSHVERNGEEFELPCRVAGGGRAGRKCVDFGAIGNETLERLVAARLEGLPEGSLTKLRQSTPWGAAIYEMARDRGILQKFFPDYMPRPKGRAADAGARENAILESGPMPANPVAENGAHNTPEPVAPEARAPETGHRALDTYHAREPALPSRFSRKGLVKAMMERGQAMRVKAGDGERFWFGGEGRTLRLPGGRFVQYAGCETAAAHSFSTNGNLGTDGMFEIRPGKTRFFQTRSGGRIMLFMTPGEIHAYFTEKGMPEGGSELYVLNVGRCPGGGTHEFPIADGFSLAYLGSRTVARREFIVGSESEEWLLWQYDDEPGARLAFGGADVELGIGRGTPFARVSGAGADAGRTEDGDSAGVLGFSVRNGTVYANMEPGHAAPESGGKDAGNAASAETPLESKWAFKSVLRRDEINRINCLVMPITGAFSLEYAGSGDVSRERKERPDGRRKERPGVSPHYFNVRDGQDGSRMLALWKGEPAAEFNTCDGYRVRVEMRGREVWAGARKLGPHEHNRRMRLFRILGGEEDYGNEKRVIEGVSLRYAGRTKERHLLDLKENGEWRKTLALRPGEGEMAIPMRDGRTLGIGIDADGAVYATFRKIDEPRPKDTGGSGNWEGGGEPGNAES